MLENFALRQQINSQVSDRGGGGFQPECELCNNADIRGQQRTFGDRILAAIRRKWVRGVG